jgi:hypothetical protein
MQSIGSSLRRHGVHQAIGTTANADCANDLAIDDERNAAG